MAWVDQFYSREGGDRVYLGDEGVAHEMNDDGTWSWIGDPAVIRKQKTLQGAAVVPCYLDYESLWNTGRTDVVENTLQDDRKRVGKWEQNRLSYRYWKSRIARW